MGSCCTITSEALGVIRADAAACAPYEACGLLFGARDAIALAVPARNVAEAPATRFEIDPVALFAALRAERQGGAAFIGCYHSHPAGDAVPSRADADAAAPDGRLWLIVAGGRVTAWRAGEHGTVNGRFTAVELLAKGRPEGQ